jgi:8-oxo-dGTP diphosphatase
MNVKFNELSEIKDEDLIYAVIIARYQNHWILCNHKERTTWEIPGGRREPGEPILDTAKRELYEETGAIDFNIKPICIYTVNGTSGLLYFASVDVLGELPDSEIEKVDLFDELNIEWTYPNIQPELLDYFKKNYDF